MFANSDAFSHVFRSRDCWLDWETIEQWSSLYNFSMPVDNKENFQLEIKWFQLNIIWKSKLIVRFFDTTFKEIEFPASNEINSTEKLLKSEAHCSEFRYELKTSLTRVVEHVDPRVWNHSVLSSSEHSTHAARPVLPLPQQSVLFQIPHNTSQKGILALQHLQRLTNTVPQTRQTCSKSFLIQ